MAGWLSALKFVPWGQVIDAAPQIVQGARKLMRRGEETVSATPTAPMRPAASLGGESRDAQLLEQLQVLQLRVNQLQEEQRASAVLIRSLAEQNAQVVRAVDTLRARTRWLAVACALLGVISTGLLAWVLSH